LKALSLREGKLKLGIQAAHNRHSGVGLESGNAKVNAHRTTNIINNKRRTKVMERKRQKGFTLVEMAIVLVIIGIILAATMKGRDLVFSAGQTQAQQAFMSKWVTIVNDYFKAVRGVLGDGTPHGSSVTPVTAPDGFADGFGNVNDFAAGVSNYRTSGGVQGADGAARDRIKQALNTAGLNPCVLIKSNLQNDLTAAGAVYACPGNLNPFEITVDSEFSGKQTISVAFVNHQVANLGGYPAGVEIRRNFIIFHNVPLDVAVRFDTTVDGIESGRGGKVLNLSAVATGYAPGAYRSVINSGARASAADWPRVTQAHRSNVFRVAYMLDF
jgi:prepilin-type N-terminal cleavage/methylation domain-containing protein